MKIEANEIPEYKMIDRVQPQQTKASKHDVGKALSDQPTSLAMDEIRHTIDKATGLIQTIVSDRLSEEVIRKIPADEYLEMLTLLDEMMSGSIDDHI